MLRKVHRLMVFMVFEDGALRMILGPEWEEVTG
jgi:hypothetical protein